MNKNITYQHQINHNERIEFIDAMRGFTMILVVIAVLCPYSTLIFIVSITIFWR